MVTVLSIGGQFVMPQVGFAQGAPITAASVRAKAYTAIDTFLSQRDKYNNLLSAETDPALRAELQDKVTKFLDLWNKARNIAANTNGYIGLLGSTMDPALANQLNNEIDSLYKQAESLQNSTQSESIKETNIDLKKGSGQRAADTGHACFYWEDTLPGVNPIACFAEVANASLEVTSFGVQLSGWVLDKSIDYSIYKISGFVKGTGPGDSAIQSAWKTIRDIANISFIFILLYLSIITILRADTSETKSVLGKIIVAAILINFSLFFTNVIIDASNVTTLYFYNSAVSGIKGGSQAIGISGVMMDKMRLPTVYNINNQEVVGVTTAPGTVVGSVDEKDPTLTWSGILIVGIFGSILFLITSFVFLAAAFLFLIRFVTLLFLIILSPIAFAAHILPGTKKYATQWWEKLFTQALFAPAFMILLAISLSIITSFTSKVGQNFGAALASAGVTEGSSDLFVNFFIVIFFLIATILTSSSLGAGGAKVVTSRGKKILDGAQKRLKGAGGASLRGTVGAASRRADEKIAETPWGNSWAGRRLRSFTTQGLAKQKWGTKKDAFGVKKDAEKEAEERALKTVEFRKTTAEETSGKLKKVYNSDVQLAQKRTDFKSEYGTYREDRKTNRAEQKTAQSELTELERRKSIGENISDAQINAARTKIGMLDRGNSASKVAIKQKISAMKDDKQRIREANPKIVEADSLAREQLNKLKQGDKPLRNRAFSMGTIGSTIGAVVAGPAGALAGAATGAALGSMIRKNRKTWRSAVLSSTLTYTNTARRKAVDMLRDSEKHNSKSGVGPETAKEFAARLKSEKERKKLVDTQVKLADDEGKGADGDKK